MPRYHLNLYNDADTMDDDGREFRDLAAAKVEAIQAARDLIAEHVKTDKPVNLSDRIEITDAAGKILATIVFRELLTIKDSRSAK